MCVEDLPTHLWSIGPPLWGCKMWVNATNATWYSIKSMEVVGWSCRNVFLQNVVLSKVLVLWYCYQRESLRARQGWLLSPEMMIWIGNQMKSVQKCPKQSFVLAREPGNLSFEYEHAKETPLVGSTLSRFIPSTRNWFWMTRPCPRNFILQLRGCPVKLRIV